MLAQYRSNYTFAPLNNYHVRLSLVAGYIGEQLTDWCWVLATVDWLLTSVKPGFHYPS